MTNLSALEKRIEELERRVKALEGDQSLTNALYDKAKELVAKHGHSSVIFLQKKLLIDYEHASQIWDRLRDEGIVSP